MAICMTHIISDLSDSQRRFSRNLCRDAAN
jgi:hypothetical protein